MAEIQHSQTKAKLLEIVAPLVDQTGILGKTDAEKEVHILSRATAAAALKIVAEIEYDAACAAIVDGGNHLLKKHPSRQPQNKPNATAQNRTGDAMLPPQQRAENGAEQ
jgi:hypothetical protein